MLKFLLTQAGCPHPELYQWNIEYGIYTYHADVEMYKLSILYCIFLHTYVPYSTPLEDLKATHHQVGVW